MFRRFFREGEEEAVSAVFPALGSEGDDAVKALVYLLGGGSSHDDHHHGKEKTKTTKDSINGYYQRDVDGVNKDHDLRGAGGGNGNGRIRVAVLSGDKDFYGCVRPWCTWLQKTDGVTPRDVSLLRVVDEAQLELDLGIPASGHTVWAALVGKKSIGITGLGLSTQSAKKVASGWPSESVFRSAIEDGSLPDRHPHLANRVYEEIMLPDDEEKRPRFRLTNRMEANLMLVARLTPEIVLSAADLQAFSPQGDKYPRVRYEEDKRQSSPGLLSGTSLAALVPDVVLHHRAVGTLARRLGRRLEQIGRRPDRDRDEEDQAPPGPARVFASVVSPWTSPVNGATLDVVVTCAVTQERAGIIVYPARATESTEGVGSGSGSGRPTGSKNERDGGGTEVNTTSDGRRGGRTGLPAWVKVRAKQGRQGGLERVVVVSVPEVERMLIGAGEGGEVGGAGGLGGRGGVNGSRGGS